MNKTLKDFNKIYKYKSDTEKYGFSEVWDIPKVSEDGFIYADCESYARYLKNNISEFKDWNYYYCKLNGIGHCVLVKNNDVIDCNIKRVVSLEQYYRMFTITELVKYSKFTIFSKIIIGSLIVDLNAIKRLLKD